MKKLLSGEMNCGVNSHTIDDFSAFSIEHKEMDYVTFNSMMNLKNIMWYETNLVQKTNNSSYICMTFWKKSNCWDTNHFKISGTTQQSLGEIRYPSLTPRN